MNGFAYTSYKHRRDQELLDRLSDAIFALKIQAQDRLEAYDLRVQDVEAKRYDILVFLEDLADQVRLVAGMYAEGEDKPDLALGALASRFARLNKTDIRDQIDTIERLRERLNETQRVRDRDFVLLDSLQGLLEEEAAEGTRGLYAL